MLRDAAAEEAEATADGPLFAAAPTTTAGFIGF